MSAWEDATPIAVCVDCGDTATPSTERCGPCEAEAQQDVEFNQWADALDNKENA